MKPTFIISSPFDTFSGYGARSRDVIKAIIATDKYDVKLLSQRWGNTPFGFCKENPQFTDLLELVIPSPLTSKPDIWMQITVPNEFQPVGNYNIGVTAGIETTVVPGEFVEGVNRMDITLTSSNHSKNVFLNSQFEKKDNNGKVLGTTKVEKPIEVLMEGADLDTYKVINTPCSLDINIKEDFAYLFVGHWLPGDIGEDRKNVGLLVKAFFETFKNKSKKPALILKTSIVGASHMDRDEVLKRINSIKQTVNSTDLPNIYLLHGDLTDTEMNELYNHSKVKAMVTTTKGEGFGRPLLEFCTTGKPIIASGWSGHLDFLNTGFTTLLKGHLENVHPSSVNNWLTAESKWFQVDPKDLKSSLKGMFKKYKEYSIKGKKQKQYVKTNFSWDKMHILIHNILDDKNKVPEIAQQIELNLPKLDLPKLKKL